MATLIASNYNSQSSSLYGFMHTGNISLKNSTFYTLKCRYKWNANGTASTKTFAAYLYADGWVNSLGAMTSIPSEMTTLMRTFTTGSNVESVKWNIMCYANGDHNNGVADGAILTVDWYELWEGDATQFSLTDAIALSENTNAKDFASIINSCTNSSYFSDSGPITSIRS